MAVRFKHWLTAVAGAASLVATGAAVAQAAFPAKPVTVVVPFSAGGPTDVVARLIGVPMGKALGQTVIIDNALGAGGTIAAAKVARAAPDGYTIFLHHMGMSTAPALYRKLSFDPLKDFEYIGQVVDVPMTLLGRKDLPANNFKELQAYVKANGNKVTLANAGLGAVSHLCGLLFMSQMGVELTTVPYKGTGPAMNDLLGGQVPVMFSDLVAALPHIKSGKLRALAVGSPKRVDIVPDVKTVAEQGFKGFEAVSIGAMMAPKGTPAAAIDRMSSELKAVLAQKDVQDRLVGAGCYAHYMTPAETGRYVTAEFDKWGKVIKDNKLTVE